MRCLRAFLLAAALSACAAQAWAHRIDEYLQATLLSVEADQVRASMRLIPGEVVAPSVIAGIDTDGDGAFSEAEQQAYARRVLGDLSISVDTNAASPKLVSWHFPAPAQMREGLGEILIEFTIGLPQRAGARSMTIANHHRGDQSVYLVNVLAPGDAAIRILDQKRDARQSRYELDFRRDSATATHNSSPTGWQNPGLAGLFKLGMHHIAEGADHLLFLMALLLPAPLIAAGSHWSSPASARRGLLHVLGIVTAFTVGHSITLGLAALGGLSMPQRPVEVLIAASILVSAAHALRPIFPGRESAVAALFGLVHGLAFAATLDRLGLSLWDRIAGTLAFNLGIEAMQLAVVASVLPSLLLASRTRLYPALRITGAVLAGTAATAWLLERSLGIGLHTDAAVDMLAQHAPVAAAALLLISLAAFWATRRPHTIVGSKGTCALNPASCSLRSPFSASAEGAGLPK